MNRRVALAAIFLVTAIAVAYGWRIFWFLTDDAFIAFRYVQNAMLGNGLVWNPNPFRPVEGYTSFLWIELLKFVWQITGIQPPVSANWLSLGFGYATLYLGYKILARMDLPESLKRFRNWFLVIVLLGTVSNRTFLAWLSSGLETSLFNFTLTLWIYFSVSHNYQNGGKYRFACLAFSAALMSFTRPDGLLYYAATLLIIGTQVKNFDKFTYLSLAFLMIPPIHLLARRFFYGFWLPNTYYAKSAGPWLESGIRYLLSFSIEYGVWFWLLIAAAAMIKLLLSNRGALSVSKKITPWISISAIVAHAGYYTFIIGGDHFEYRVYSHLILLLFLSSIWLTSKISVRPLAALGIPLFFVLVSWPIPWMHWTHTKDLQTREQTHILIHPIAKYFPHFIRTPIGWWDGWQAWLIAHYVCMRHQEHKAFYDFNWARWKSVADRSPGVTWEQRPVFPLEGVGIPGWLFPQVAIIDLFGLNDIVIARIPLRIEMRRRMSHERRAPREYVECFQPNVSVSEEGRMIVKPRQESITETDQRIQNCESKFAK